MLGRYIDDQIWIVLPGRMVPPRGARPQSFRCARCQAERFPEVFAQDAAEFYGPMLAPSQQDRSPDIGLAPPATSVEEVD